MIIPNSVIVYNNSHGFSTKRKGHGFGLHSCANYMTEMGGKMWAESDGHGASFILQFPLSK
ncbi:MAG: ATP-binding protein [Proteobacteria bacterium]|nr:ATP-binding protein [Pseudomonadota bacterium]